MRRTVTSTASYGPRAFGLLLLLVLAIYYTAVEVEARARPAEADGGAAPAPTTHSPTTTMDGGGDERVDEREVYDYYARLLPALLSPLPVLASRLASDASSALRSCGTSFVQFLFPVWFRRWTVDASDAIARTAAGGGEFVDHLLERLDSDRDGTISAKEWGGSVAEEVEAALQQYYRAVAGGVRDQHGLLMRQLGHDYAEDVGSWYGLVRSLISRCLAVDWSLGQYLWNTCSGLILVLVVTSLIPGRLHGWTGRLLRFPVLGMTYMLIAGELLMYTLVRFSIRLLEWTFANRRHRAMRKGMANAKSYDEWYAIARELDDSQGRGEWTRNVNDDTAYRYSWSFILELLRDMRRSRMDRDVLTTMAVLQQCTRKNVGGIMSDDLFSFTNCGEPKVIVSEFVDEVVRTMHWLTEEVRAGAGGGSEFPPSRRDDAVETRARELEGELDGEKAEMEGGLKAKREEERAKLMSNLVSWATLGVLGGERGNADATDGNDEDGASDDQGVSGTNIPDHEYARRLVLREKVKTFLKRARAAYGRTALCLSGGAMMGCYHFGAVEALLETGLLPHIISGTSAGSIIGAMLCTRTEEELRRDLRPEVLAPKMSIFASSWSERLLNWWRRGSMFDRDDWYRRAQFFTCGEMTFEEAYRKTGRVFCVTLSATSKKAPPVLINYITAPNVVIASAVLASAAVPGFVEAIRLKIKDENGVVRDQRKSNDEEYRDGSIDSDIPTNGLSEMLNCRFFLAAQANPHIVPFFYNSKGDVGRPSRWSSGIRDDSWRGGFLLSALEMYLKNDMRSKFHFLNDLEVALGFTSTMMTQTTYSGTTTIGTRIYDAAYHPVPFTTNFFVNDANAIVPQACLKDFTLLFAEQSVDDMKRYFQGGNAAAYQHVAMLKLHYKIAHALDECLASLEFDESPNSPPRRRRQLLKQKSLKAGMSPAGGLHFGRLNQLPESDATSPASTVSDGYITDDEHEKGGFDGVDCAFGPGRLSFDT